jgi:ribosome-associated protein
VPESARETLDRCVELLQSVKGEELVVLDVREVADFADYFLICSGNSDTHVRALGDTVYEGMKKAGQQAWHTEGMDSRKWVLFDFVDVVVHIFLPKTREFYGLERLWGDVPAEHIEDAPPVAEVS